MRQSNCYSFLYACCCFCSGAQLCPILCNPMDCSTPGLPVPHHLPKFAQVHSSLNWWCCPAISSIDALFASCPRSFPASRTFPVSHLFTSDDQNTGVSASPSVLPVNIQGCSPLKLKLVWSPGCPRDFQESSPAPQFYMPVTPKFMSSSRTSLLNTIPFYQLSTGQMAAPCGYLRSLFKSEHTNQNSSLLSHPQIHCSRTPFCT